MKTIRTPLQFNHPPFPNLTSQILKCFLRTISIIINTMAQHSLESREAQIVQVAKKSYNPSLVVNLT
jgi:hypothetical protein